MGYTTEYYGEIFISPPLNEETIEYVNKFSRTRRMRRDELVLMRKYGGKFGFDWSYGTDGEYYIGEEERSADKEGSVLDYNYPPSTQPGLWCDWIINSRGNIEWNGNEKFYDGDTWMKYIIDNFIAPQGHICNGSMEACGEESGDNWILAVKDNVVSAIDLALVEKDAIFLAVDEELKDHPELAKNLKEKLLLLI